MQLQFNTPGIWDEGMLDTLLKTFPHIGLFFLKNFEGQRTLVLDGKMIHVIRHVFDDVVGPRAC